METNAYERISSAYHGLLQEREHLECRIRETASILNTMSPINRLPAEVLVHIFTYVKPSFQDGEFDYTTYTFYPEREVAAWLSFVGVCRSWRTVACTTPLLWRDIRIGKCTKLPLFRLFFAVLWTRRRRHYILRDLSYPPFFERASRPRVSYTQALLPDATHLRVARTGFVRLPPSRHASPGGSEHHIWPS